MQSSSNDDEPDLYEVLGVSADATEAEITTAYYTLARRHHPDTSSHVDPSSQQFKMILEAYQVLTDPDSRRHYDQSRRSHRVKIRAAPGRPPSELAFESRTNIRDAPTRHLGTDIHATLPITPEEARHGGLCEIRITRLVCCSICLGSGESEQVTCAVCQATGQTRLSETVTLQIPPAAKTGTMLTIHGRGNESAHPLAQKTTRRARGNLQLRIEVRPSW